MTNRSRKNKLNGKKGVLLSCLVTEGFFPTNAIKWVLAKMKSITISVSAAELDPSMYESQIKCTCRTRGPFYLFTNNWIISWQLN